MRITPLLLVCCLSTPALADKSFSDPNLANADWTVTYAADDEGCPMTPSNMASFALTNDMVGATCGATGDPCRQLTMHYDQSGYYASVYGPFTWTTSMDGVIDNVDFSITATSVGAAVGIAVSQGTLKAHLLLGGINNVSPNLAINVSAASLAPLGLDLSPAGLPIKFGYVIASGGSSNGCCCDDVFNDVDYTVDTVGIAVHLACGNNMLDPGEGCDDGNLMGGDGCSATCKVEGCGMGVDPCAAVDCATGFTCNNVTMGVTCVAQCVSAATCGNNMLEAGETCDDGGTVNGDGCSATCQSEACSLDNDPCTYTRCRAPLVCMSSNVSGVCQADCVQPTTGAVCGNNMVEAGEECDDGNTMAEDGCSATCQSEACSATNDPCQLVRCHAPLLCMSSNVNGVCRANCVEPASTAVCGNGTVETGEECDDHNTTAGDGCSATCMTEGCTSSSNPCAAVDCAPGFTCHSVTVGTACQASCEPVTVCGNHTVETGEACDDGNTTSGDGCSSTCQSEACSTDNNPCAAVDCRPPFVCMPTMVMGVCHAECVKNATAAAVCGNGILETGEACEDGNTTAGDGCSASCQKEPCAPAASASDSGSTTAGAGCAAVSPSLLGTVGLLALALRRRRR